MGDLLKTGVGQDFDNLIGGTALTPLTRNIVIAANAGELSKGSVLGKLTTGGKYKLVDSTSTDGSEVASVVLKEDVTVGAIDVVATVFICGVFFDDALIFGGSDTLAQHEDNLRKVNIITTKGA